MQKKSMFIIANNIKLQYLFLKKKKTFNLFFTYSSPTIVRENFIFHLTFLFWKEITKKNKRKGSSNHFLQKKNSKSSNFDTKKIGKKCKGSKLLTFTLFTQWDYSITVMHKITRIWHMVLNCNAKSLHAKTNMMVI